MFCVLVCFWLLSNEFFFALIYFLQMKLQVFFEVGKWVELEDRWVFRASEGHSKVILVEEDILFVDFVDKTC